MFGSETLEIAIGVVFVYILFSILCTAIREGIESLIKSRAAYLDVGIRELLCDTKGVGLAKELYEHPLIFGLFPGQYESKDADRVKREGIKTGKHPHLLLRGRNLPSYIPSRNFALALMDLAARGPVDAPGALATSPEVTVANIRANISNLGDVTVQRAILIALDTSNNSLDTAQKNIEAWYNSSMDRVGGWYKRSSQKVIFAIALAGAFAMNINTIKIADYLHRNEAARGALTAQAGVALKDAKFVEDNEKVIAAANTLSLPIGWGVGWSLPRTGDEYGSNRSKELSKTATIEAPFNFGAGDWWYVILGPILGLLATALAACLGAPFWFDTLNKLMVVRSTVKPAAPPEESESKTQSKAINNLANAVAAKPAAAADKVVQNAVADPAPVADDLNPDDLIDGCSIDFLKEPATADEDLPAATGGVA